MKERPILFSGPMVRAILEGRKDVTRRAVKGVPYDLNAPWFGPTESTKGWFWSASLGYGDGSRFYVSALAVPGDRLWVRETWKAPQRWTEDGVAVYYQADDSGPRIFEVGNEQDGPDEVDAWLRRWLNRNNGAWQPSIFMPRWASRLTLDVVSVGVERLHAITDDEARREGVADREAFRALWIDINGAESWDANPWVWRIEFRRTP